MEDDQNSKNELEESKKQAEEYLNNWKRERADFVNYKKDETKRVEEFLKFSTEGIILDLIDVIDAIEVARKNIPDIKELKDWLEGFDNFTVHCISWPNFFDFFTVFILHLDCFVKQRIKLLIPHFYLLDSEFL